MVPSDQEFAWVVGNSPPLLSRGAIPHWDEAYRSYQPLRLNDLHVHGRHAQALRLSDDYSPGCLPHTGTLPAGSSRFA
jgi:hypothetical protein